MQKIVFTLTALLAFNYISAMIKSVKDQIFMIEAAKTNKEAIADLLQIHSSLIKKTYGENFINQLLNGWAINHLPKVREQLALSRFNNKAMQLENALISPEKITLRVLPGGHELAFDYFSFYACVMAKELQESAAVIQNTHQDVTKKLT